MVKRYYRAFGTYSPCSRYWTHDFIWGKPNSSESSRIKFIVNCWTLSISRFFINFLKCTLTFYLNRNTKLLYIILSLHHEASYILLCALIKRFLFHGSKFKINAPQRMSYVKIFSMYIIIYVLKEHFSYGGY